MTATSSTYNWIKHIPPALLKQDQEPLTGNMPSFPWGPFSSRLSEFFHLPGLTIQPSQIVEERAPEDQIKGFGEDPLILYITLAPSLPPISWIMSSQDVQFLMSLLLTQPKEQLQAIEPAYLKEFYQFLTIECLQALMNVDFDKTLDPHFDEKGELPKEHALCQDVSIQITEKTLFGRLVMSVEFRQSWKERYAQRSFEIPKSMLQNVIVTIHIEAGRTSLNASQWAEVKLGDFILLDFCSLKTEGEGRVMLSVKGMPLFRGKIKDGNIKILEHPLYHEGDTDMSSENNLNEGKPPMHEDEGDSLFEESEEHTADEELEDAFEDSELEEEDENAEKTETEEEQEAAAEPSEAPPEQEQVIPSKAAAPQKTSTIQEIPLSIVVEVGRLQMSLQKLTELQPGNLLELNVRPENGVDLVVNGKCVARGELLLLGDALGVRVLDIG